MQRALDRYDEGVTPASICDIDQLEAMRLAEQAWAEVTKDTIANCWRKSGILPTADSISIDEELEHDVNSRGIISPADTVPDPKLTEAEAALAQVLNELQEVGVLQKKYLVDIEDLIQMPEEAVTEDATDEDIFEAVQKLWSQEADREIHGGDDDEEIDPKPSWKEALQAAATLRKYIVDLDDLFARKMEGDLSSFGHETRREEVRTMVNSSIYDYFTYT
ncbi:hypothetical protein DFH08DRAFT_976788 [Mycena albidolilacea]|uniref:DDE-1 domain-containing protein n=1 Tax=Mycena albidolilacea TaxID=1033008 RepID=A0AAD6Z2B4_9AGAR|nr:hypothetical protein DFH08DRAFT_976788 [Mycena albidolilacea]